MLHKHHIVPRHAGGSDDLSNIETITIEEHADRHRVLFEIHGRWQDELAWKGLAGIIGHEEVLRLTAIAANTGKIFTKQHRLNLSNAMRGLKKSLTHIKRQSESRARNWELTSPAGNVSVIHNLQFFCQKNDLCISNLSSVAHGKRAHHKGWKCKLLKHINSGHDHA